MGSDDLGRAMISKTAEYALRAVTCLANDTQSSASADVLAEKTKVPRRYLTRVLQDLSTSGMLASRSGPGGGYILIKPIEEITILDVINAVSPLERISACPLGLKSHTSLCPLHAELDRAFAATESALAAVTIRQLLESTNPIVPLREVPL
ncbi:MAG: Rrf2 family transcriptional regulator [Phycisphaerales bacterium]|nr:Rrf2 family transcriptional regulator [Phycisphaerales bacterium]